MSDREELEAEQVFRDAEEKSNSADRLPCGHPSACDGLAGVDADQPGCGWCADIADNGTLIDHLSRTYDHFSGGRISKPLTHPEEVFAVASDLATEDAEEAAQEARRDVLEACGAAAKAAIPGILQPLRDALAGVEAYVYRHDDGSRFIRWGYVEREIIDRLRLMADSLPRVSEVEERPLLDTITEADIDFVEGREES